MALAVQRHLNLVLLDGGVSQPNVPMNVGH